MLRLLDGENRVLKEPTSAAPFKMGTGTCVFSPKLNTMTFLDKMLFIVCEFGVDSLDSNRRLRVAPLMLADTKKPASVAIKYCCWLIAQLRCFDEALAFDENAVEFQLTRQHARVMR